MVGRGRRRMSIGILLVLVLALVHLRVYFSDLQFYPYLAHTDGAYGEIMVFPDDPLVMSVDGLPQTGLPQKLLNEKVSEHYFYDQRYFLPLLKHMHPHGKEALIIGLGGGLMEKVFDSLGVNSEFVEINPKVTEYACEYFNVTSPVHLSDGRWFLRKTKKKYDFIVLDVYQSDELGWHMLTHEALELAKTRMNNDGILTLHLLSVPKPTLINNSIVQTLRKIFPHVEVVAAYPENQEQLQSLFFFASLRSISLPENVPGIHELNSFRLSLPYQKGVILADGYFPLELSWATIAQEWRQAFRADRLGLYNFGLIGMAIGGFLDAQVRSKVSRAKFNMKEISKQFVLFKNHYGHLPDDKEGFKALERYYQDQGQPEMIQGVHELMRDPFSEQRQLFFYRLFTIPPSEIGIIGNLGPDQDIDFPARLAAPGSETTSATSWDILIQQTIHKELKVIHLIYDPTNGTVSDGDILHLVAE
jgi:spermidine synthase